MKSTPSTTLCALLFGALALTACDDAGMGRAEVEFVVPEAPEVQTSRLYPGPCLTQSDYDIDGTINTETHYAYDDQDRWISLEHYLEGELKSTAQWSYNTNGNTSTMVSTGTLNRTTHRIYNGQNQLIEFTIDIDSDGTIDIVTVYGYNDDGLRTNEVATHTDGTITTTTFTHNADGHVVSEQRKTEHINGSSTDCRDIFTDRELRLEDTLADDDCDGMPESIQSITHNEDWQPILDEKDNNADGIIDTRSTYQYDTRGNLIYQLNESTRPVPPDAVYQSRFSSTTATFTAAGKPLEIRHDLDHDGVTDRTETYTYDRFGNPLTWLDRRMPHERFGRWDDWTVYSYDCFDAKEDTP